MREELIVKILNAFAPPERETMQSMKMQLEIILADYEITKRCTELVALNEEKNDVIVKRFIASKLAEGRSTRTLGYYKQTIEAFLAKVNKDFDAITADDIRLYLALRINRDKVTKTTANNERRNISAFYCWLQTEEIILKNPMKKIAPIKVTKEKKKAFSEMEMELLRDGCKTARERALIEILASTWCRVSEVAQIRLDEIDKNEILVPLQPVVVFRMQVVVNEDYRVVFCVALDIDSDPVVVRLDVGYDPVTYLFGIVIRAVVFVIAAQLTYHPISRV